MVGTTTSKESSKKTPKRSKMAVSRSKAMSLYPCLPNYASGAVISDIFSLSIISPLLVVVDFDCLGCDEDQDNHQEEHRGHPRNKQS